MSLTKKLSTFALITLISGCVIMVSPSRADFHTQKELSIDASTLSTMDIEAGSGSLVIKGQKGLTKILVTADIYTDPKHKDNYELTLTQSGKTGVLVAKTKSSSGLWNGNSPHINVVVHMPASLMLTVNDGSGDTEISDIQGNVKINDGSGSIHIENIASNVTVIDGSGQIDVYDITGSLTIDDGSGGIEVANVGGNLSINDGSGNIHVKKVTGYANINDGSGDLTVKHITGMITLDDGSGNIYVDNAGGLKVIESGSGELEVNNVKGDVKIAG